MSSDMSYSYFAVKSGSLFLFRLLFCSQGKSFFGNFSRVGISADYRMLDDDGLEFCLDVLVHLFLLLMKKERVAKIDVWIFFAKLVRRRIEGSAILEKDPDMIGDPERTFCFMRCYRSALQTLQIEERFQRPAYCGAHHRA